MAGDLASAWKSDAYAHLKTAEKALSDPRVVGVFIVEIIHEEGEPKYRLNGATAPGVSTLEAEGALIGSAERLAGYAKELTVLS